MNLRAFLQDLESKSPEEIWRIPGEVEPGSDITALVLEHGREQVLDDDARTCRASSRNCRGKGHSHWR